MFGFLKNLLRQPDASPAPLPEPAPAARTVSSAAMAASAPRQSAVGTQSPCNGSSGKGVDVPLQKILDSLPAELQPRVLVRSVGMLSIPVPLEKVLAQLSTGAVRIPFGDLRQMASGVFSPETDRDRLPISLPLGEILSRLNPALITRRRVQRTVDLPAEIASPFDMQGRGASLVVEPSRTSTAPVAAPAPVRPVFVPPPQEAPPPAPPVARAPLAFSTLPPIPMPSSRTLQPLQPPASLIQAMPEPMPPAPGVRESRPVSPAPANRLEPEAPAPELQRMAAPAATPEEPAAVCVGLGMLAEGWPESVRQEMAGSNLGSLTVALPLGLLEQAMKQGRVAFTWKALRSWIQPAMAPWISPNDEVLLTLPLKVIAPLFLERQRHQMPARRRVVVDPGIPNLFGGTAPGAAAAVVSGSAPAATPPASRWGSSLPPRPADTNYYTREDRGMPAVETPVVQQSPSPGTRFVAKYATPNEIISRAAALEGVAGALITLPDGLMVASRVSPDLNGETLAAFLPQIFSKVSQCTKELRMGELNNLNFTVGTTPWKIFRVNAIFFAAFGRAGQPLPTAQLAELAAELDHKPK